MANDEKEKTVKAAPETIITEEVLDRIEARAETGTVTREDAQVLVDALREALRRGIKKGRTRKVPEKMQLPLEEARPAEAQKTIDLPVGSVEAGLPPRVSLYTDGGCQGNPGPGGWGAVLQSAAGGKELSGYHPDTTNNRMELTAVVEGLNALEKPSVVKVTTDSQYVKNGITVWIHSWKRKGWRTSTGSRVKNEDLWRALEAAAARHTVTWEWVRGHSGHPENERCDELAQQAIRNRKGKRNG